MEFLVLDQKVEIFRLLDDSYVFVEPELSIRKRLTGSGFVELPSTQASRSRAISELGEAVLEGRGSGARIVKISRVHLKTFQKARWNVFDSQAVLQSKNDSTRWVSNQTFDANRQCRVIVETSPYNASVSHRHAKAC
jgi:hypothetical protein